MTPPRPAGTIVEPPYVDWRSNVSSLTRWVLAHKRIVAVAWIVLTVAGIAAAGPASKAMNQKFTVPGKEGWETNVSIAKQYGGDPSANPLLPVVTLPAGKTVTSPGVHKALATVNSRLAKALPGARIASYASTGDKVFVSKDGRTTFALVYPGLATATAFG